MIEQPCFFAATHKDAVCFPVVFKPMMEKRAKDLVSLDFYTGHWVQFEDSDRLNNEFELWLQEKLDL
jgi:soluble epoxide hydrolase / lipid-phosphate phosphatase